MVFDWLPSRMGHFLLESGHHGELWLDLELLCLKPELVRPAAVELAAQLKELDAECVCGPLVEGAFVGLMVAEELAIEFTYSERITGFPFRYRLPNALRRKVN